MSGASDEDFEGMTKFFPVEKSLQNFITRPSFSPIFFYPRPKFFPDFFISTERRILIVIFHYKSFHGCFSIEQKIISFKRILNNKEPKIEPNKHNKLSQKSKL